MGGFVKSGSNVNQPGNAAAVVSRLEFVFVTIKVQEEYIFVVAKYIYFFVFIIQCLQFLVSLRLFLQVILRCFCVNLL